MTRLEALIIVGLTVGSWGLNTLRRILDELKIANDLFREARGAGKKTGTGTPVDKAIGSARVIVKPPRF